MLFNGWCFLFLLVRFLVQCLCYFFVFKDFDDVVCVDIIVVFKGYVVFLIGLNFCYFVFEVFQSFQCVFVDYYVVMQQMYVSGVMCYVFGDEIVCNFVYVGYFEDVFDLSVVDKGFFDFCGK